MVYSIVFHEIPWSAVYSIVFHEIWFYSLHVCVSWNESYSIVFHEIEVLTLYFMNKIFFVCVCVCVCLCVCQCVYVCVCLCVCLCLCVCVVWCTVCGVQWTMYKYNNEIFLLYLFSGYGWSNQYMPYYQYPWGELCATISSLVRMCSPLAMMPGYAPYMYAMAGRNGYRTRTRDGYLTGKLSWTCLYHFSWLIMWSFVTTWKFQILSPLKFLLRFSTQLT